jgi:hypothetical protein
MRIVFLSLLTLLSFAWSFSGLYRNGPGEERASGGAREQALGGSGAALIKNGFSIQNPASMDINPQAQMDVTLSWEEAVYQAGSFQTGDWNLSLENFRFQIPLGALGSVGLGYWQRYRKDFSVNDTTGTGGQSLEQSGGLYEVLPAWSFRLPGAMRNLSLGVAYHYLMGKERMDLSYEFAPAGDNLSDLMASETSVRRYINVNNSGTDMGGYFSGSLQLHTKNTDIYAGYAMAHTIKKSADYLTIINARDTLIASKELYYQDIPMQLSGGVAWEILKNYTLSGDFWLRNWSDIALFDVDDFTETTTKQGSEEYFAGLGFEKAGSDKYYDSFLKKMTYRIGLSWHNLYIGEVNEYSGALGLGIPLGKRGSHLDLSLYGGTRADASEQSENFWGVRLSFAGIGNWE